MALYTTADDDNKRNIALGFGILPFLYRLHSGQINNLTIQASTPAVVVDKYPANGGQSIYVNLLTRCIYVYVYCYPTPSRFLHY